MKYVTTFLAVVLASTALAKDAEPKKDELACAKNVDIEKIMNDKGYALLLNMTRTENNKDGIIESLWVGGQSAVITASVAGSDSSCFMANFGNMIINPNAVEGIWEAYKKQNKQKDI